MRDVLVASRRLARVGGVARRAALSPSSYGVTPKQLHGFEGLCMLSSTFKKFDKPTFLISSGDMLHLLFSLPQVGSRYIALHREAAERAAATHKSKYMFPFCLVRFILVIA